jgi:hypothetical protein
MNTKDTMLEKDTLLFKVTSLLYMHDPAGIVFDESNHEYETEAGAIIPRLPECQNAQDCARMIHGEFMKAFAGLVRPIDEYGELGKAVWKVWQAAI